MLVQVRPPAEALDMVLAKDSCVPPPGVLAVLLSLPVRMLVYLRFACVKCQRVLPEVRVRAPLAVASALEWTHRLPVAHKRFVATAFRACSIASSSIGPGSGAGLLFILGVLARLLSLLVRVIACA